MLKRITLPSSRFLYRLDGHQRRKLLNRTLSTQDQILDAAEIVAVEGGAAHLTLDAVSKRAGIK